MNEYEIISKLLKIEHQSIAYKAKLIEEKPEEISYLFLLESLGVLDKLSRKNDIKSKQKIILIVALLWTYRKPEWTGLKEFLILVLSRAGFGPTSIMLEDNFKQSFVYTHQDSIFNELSIIVNQLKNEINIGNQTFLLSDYQKEVWDQLYVNKLLGISAPTSAGKSYIILLKAAELLLKQNGIVIYIVPTLSLINQVSNDFRKILKQFNLNEYIIKNSFEEDLDENTIYVLTQEKAISAFEQKNKPFSNVRLLVVDEIQNLERVSNDDETRAKLLYDLLIEFRNTIKPECTIIAGPRVASLRTLGIKVFGEENSSEINTDISPVFNITYSISKENNLFYFKQYCDYLNHPNKLLIINSDFIVGYGKKKYETPYLNFFSTFLQNIALNDINIVFAPNPNTAEKIAEYLLENSNLNCTLDKLKELSEYINFSVSSKYVLANCINKGIAFHHGKLPTNIRIVLEKAIKQNLIKNIVCTTTLMQGVNLPAQNLFMRSPYLSIQRTAGGIIPKLSNYEISNLRGRAGRLMQDFIGRSYIMDESSFNDLQEKNQQELFEPVVKTIDAGYGSRFKENKSNIIKTAAETSEINYSLDISFYSIYIRQCILKYGDKSIEMLAQVGIEISIEDYRIIKSRLDSLSIPKDLCLRNRYWDPFTLNRIYLQTKINLPKDIFESDFVNKLKRVLLILYNEYTDYFRKFLKNYNQIFDESKAYHISRLAYDWIHEKSLSTIFNDDYYSDSEKIGNTIAELNNTISYGLPRLLKPFYDILLPDSNLLSFFETGIYHKTTKKIFELNIPRETAIYLKNKYFSESKDCTDKEIISKLSSIKDNENYWITVQFEHLL